MSKSDGTGPVATSVAFLVCSIAHDWPAMSISGLLPTPNTDPSLAAASADTAYASAIQAVTVGLVV